ncbi:hypothetical protein AU156_gp041 [Edwardsiella phage PEi20]|uniref:Uncharacterized protein n=1 Tax=Edwardsiella phage PEi20 TaxID=1608310 RepID=A0A0B6VTM1_9CAUD|nr:hypothetical protein AU156_gp041 [Edwardsiella phage PEi20]BAQ22691.1 conserved hypothetical protein [Edwardsiella phage PEi20]
MPHFRVPIYSMRSHETGEYAVLKDGNLQLHLNRARPGDIIAVPKNATDVDELRELFPEFEFTPLWYKENAFETRKHFWEENQWVVDSLIEYYDVVGLVTDITGYTGRYPVFFNFNITMNPEKPLFYIDQFIETDVKSVNRSKYTTVLNQCQKDVLVAHGALDYKIIVDQKVIRPSVIERYARDLAPIFVEGIFHPFRISDPCYRFGQVVECAIVSGQPVYITDPNDSFDRSHYPEEALIRVFKPSKTEYYQILKGRPHIQYFENPEKVFHPGLAEFIYFNVFISSPYNIPSYDDVVIKE